MNCLQKIKEFSHLVGNELPFGVEIELYVDMPFHHAYGTSVDSGVDSAEVWVVARVRDVLGVQKPQNGVLVRTKWHPLSDGHLHMLWVNPMDSMNEYNDAEE